MWVPFIKSNLITFALAIEIILPIAGNGKPEFTGGSQFPWNFWMLSLIFKRFSQKYFPASSLITKRFSTTGAGLVASISHYLFLLFSLHAPPSQLQTFVHMSQHIYIASKLSLFSLNFLSDDKPLHFLNMVLLLLRCFLSLSSLGMSLTLPLLVNHLVLHAQPSWK